MKDKCSLARTKRIKRNQVKYRGVDFAALRQSIYQDTVEMNQALRSKTQNEEYVQYFKLSLLLTGALLFVLMIG